MLHGLNGSKMLEKYLRLEIIFATVAFPLSEILPVLEVFLVSLKMHLQKDGLHY